MGVLEEVDVLDKAMNEKSILQSKILKAFKYLDSDNSGKLDRREFWDIMEIVDVNLHYKELLRLFDYMDVNKNGMVEMNELQRFLQNPYHPRDLIRVIMSQNLTHPNRFLQYHIVEVDELPLKFRLKPGAKKIAAFLDSSNFPNKPKSLLKGSMLIYINASKVDEVSYMDIMKVFSSLPLPFELTFQNWDTVSTVKTPDSKGNFKRQYTERWPDKLSLEEQKLTRRPYSSPRQPEVINQIHDSLILPPHCKHCPPDTAWYLSMHRFVDDENYSQMSHLFAYGIIFLIILSTLSYILITIPSFEEWAGWNNLEAVISVLFTLEFGIRLACCRNIALYMKDPMNIIDFCAVAPFWVEVLTEGAIQAKVLRVVRAVRLLRLIRLSKSGVIGEIMDVYINTFEASMGMLLTLFGMSMLVLIIVSSFVTIFENGSKVLFTECNSLNVNQVCLNSTEINLLWNLSSGKSAEDCKNACESSNLCGCCQFDQFTGDCRLYQSTTISSTNDPSLFASLCNLGEAMMRSGETGRSPFLTVIDSFWWASVTMTIVGYGELYPLSSSGRLVAVVAFFAGLFFFALPVTVVGYHFLVARTRAQEVKLTKSYETLLEKRQKEGVIDLLEQANRGLDMGLFGFDEELVFLTAGLNTKKKIEQILSCRNGWSYLPFASAYDSDIPTISQFNLFILFTIFGRTHQKRQRAFSKKKSEFNRCLESFVMSPGTTRRSRRSHAKVERSMRRKGTSYRSQGKSISLRAVQSLENVN